MTVEPSSARVPSAPYSSLRARAPSRRAGRPICSDTDALGRSHRSGLGKARLLEAIERTRALLRLPADYRLGIVPASDTGAMEMAIWSLLGAAARNHARLGELRRRLGDRRRQTAQARRRHPHRRLRRDRRTWRNRSGERRRFHLERHDQRRPRAQRRLDRRRPRRPDALRRDSAAFAQDIDWAKIDVGTFSWQKALGGEAAHGMLVLWPRAVERLESAPAPRPLPKIFRLTKAGS